MKSKSILAIGFACLSVCLTFSCAPNVRDTADSPAALGDDTVEESPPVGSAPVGDDDDAAIDSGGSASPAPGADEVQPIDDPSDAAGDDSAQVDGGDDGPEAAGLDVAPGPPFDAGEGGVCPEAVGPGDLNVTELMIESVAGTGDHGEWIEVTSTRDCALNLNGLHGEAPSGSKVRVVDVDDDMWLPAFGTFVIADSTDPAFNDYLPGTVVAWAGQPGDVLRNKGATITLLADTQLVTTITYPALTLTVGASIAFPADCPASRIADWTAWQVSTASWFPSFYGTPNAPNTDVHCPQ
jgi:hypothetical protein